MQEFIYIFRADFEKIKALSGKENQDYWQSWTHWMGQLGDTVKSGAGLTYEGSTLREPQGVTVLDGPYAETREIVTGFITVEAESRAAAEEMAKSCPDLHYGGSVEIRTAMPMGS